MISAPLFEGRFRLLRTLGEGRLGTVFEAEATYHRRRVALKVVHPEHALAVLQRARLLEKVRRLTQVPHPHVMPVVEVGPAEASRPYWAMDLHDGQSLEVCLQTSRDGLAWSRCRPIALGIASALAHAHRHGIVGHVVKPKDVLVPSSEPCAAEGRGVRVLDLGLAPFWRECRHDQRFLQRTVPYLAPELLGMHVGTVRSDVYAFGVLLYELLSGARPFSDLDPARVWDQHRSAAVPPLRESSRHGPRRLGDLPRCVEDLVMTCLAKEASDRFADMEEVHRALLVMPYGRSHDHIAPARHARRDERSRSLHRNALLGLGSGLAIALGASAMSSSFASTPLDDVFQDVPNIAAAFVDSGIEF